MTTLLVSGLSTVAAPGAMSPAVLGLEGHMLVSVWKPLLLLLPFVGWAWIITSYYDKHAARFFLPRETWNLIHMTCGLLAAVGALAIPIEGEVGFWIGFATMLAILGGDLGAYAIMANRDERVPEEFHVRLDLSKWKEARAQKAVAKKQGKVELVIKGPDKSAVAVPENDTPEFAVRVLAEAVVIRALDQRASQFDLGPGGKDGAYAASYLVDGVRQAGDALPPADAIKVIDFWKACAKLDLTDRRRRLMAELTVERGPDKHKLRVIASGAQGGMRLMVLIDPEKQVRRKTPDLGLLEPQLTELKAMVGEPVGVVLLASPPDMGRTSTLYALLKMHDAYTSNVQTVEMEPQDSLEGIRQNPFEGKGEGPEYATLARSILRRDPQVLGIAELPDDATAKEIAKAEVERTRVYLSLRADNALAAIQVYVKAVGDVELAAKGLRGVLAQKLARKLCVNCRQAYVPSPDMLKKLGLPADKVKQLFKKGGQVLIKGNRPEVCPVCRGIGYTGQEGVFEVFRIGDAERALITAGNFSGLRAEFRKKGLPTIQQAALRKAVEGTTSVEEVLRVTAEAAVPARPPVKPATPGQKEGSSGPAVPVG
ncbi:MAG: ATPase, T2SS/T4P/T4SS family [Phycisphaerales bacterium]